MKDAELVSVIMPAFCAEAYLSQAIDSVLAQSYPNWELLILDDQSPDGTREIAQSYAQRDPRIRCIRNEQNVGVAQTRNHGIDLSQGDWIAFLDSDDIWHPKKLETQLAAAKSAGADLVYTSYAMFRDEDQRRAEYLVPESVDYESLLLENVIGCSTVMVRRTFLENHRFSSELYHEDYALWLELLRSGAVAVGCPDVLVEWRISKDSRSYNKLNAAKNRWAVYRQAEKLPLWKSASAFAVYAVRGIVKVRKNRHAE